ncbi:hypothetical protein [Lachnoclostridium sp. Marseille-P6806]|uniref:hypothetical protein n=1 Tax=Lachnoclostridium sp. Marseille-P6806 TaxID=2364793 RepID=UPI00103150A3|nr:hypothetical protein [Lachnoclostridium sp. Marseille-P6806]
MLEVNVPAREYWDAQKEEFFKTKETTLRLEHSLISLTKWEQKYKKPYLSQGPQTTEESMYYIQCMSLDKNIDPYVIAEIQFHPEILKTIEEYIRDPMTATTINSNTKENHTKSKEILTSELIYYYMTALNIPFECEKWHLNKLITLIEVANVKNNPKKMSKNEVMKQNTALNKARRAKYHSKG